MYKFKAGTDRDITTLKNDQLWISTLAKMNDPMDLGFYIKGKAYSEEEICNFQEALNQSFVVVSLAKKVQNRRLWNYYTNGMKGFALDYRIPDLIKALKDMGASDPIKSDVSYDDKKLDLTDMLKQYLDFGIIPSLQDAEPFLFHKDNSWSSEDEYRIITDTDFLKKYPGAIDEGGLPLNGVIPREINVGYKMSRDAFDKIAEYAHNKGITVRRFIPDFRKSSSELFKSMVVIGKNAGEEHDEKIIDRPAIDPRFYFKTYKGEYTID